MIIRKTVAIVIVVALIIFWSIPLQAALALSNLESIGKIPGVGGVVEWLAGLNSFVRGIIEGILPAVVVIIFYSLLVPVLKSIARFECEMSRSGVEQKAEKYYVAFLFINVFFQSLVGGTFWGIIDNIEEFANEPLEIIHLLAIKIPAQVNFFIALVLAKSVLTYMLQLLRPAPVIMSLLNSKLAKSHRDEFMAFQRAKFSYASKYGWHMLIFLITLVLSCIAPLILVFAILYFFIAYLVDFHNHLYVFNLKWEGHGHMWRSLFGQICIALFVYQITILGIIALVGFWGSAFLIPLPFITIAYYVYVREKFFRQQEFGSLDQEIEDLGLSDNQMKAAYLPPVMAPVEEQTRLDRIENINASEFALEKEIPADPAVDPEREGDRKLPRERTLPPV
jgi:hypothetical protein